MTFLLVALAALFHLGCALVLGGTAAVSFAAAPSLFRTLPADAAERGFGEVLRAFDRLAQAGALLGGLAALARAGLGDAAGPWALGGGLLLAAGAVTTHVRLVLRPRMDAHAPPPPEAGGKAAWPEAARLAFGRLHRAYVRAYAVNLLLGAAATTTALLPG